MGGEPQHSNGIQGGSEGWSDSSLDAGVDRDGENDGTGEIPDLWPDLRTDDGGLGGTFGGSGVFNQRPRTLLQDETLDALFPGRNVGMATSIGLNSGERGGLSGWVGEDGASGVERFQMAGVKGVSEVEMIQGEISNLQNSALGASFGLNLPNLSGGQKGFVDLGWLPDTGCAQGLIKQSNVDHGSQSVSSGDGKAEALTLSLQGKVGTKIKGEDSKACTVPQEECDYHVESSGEGQTVSRKHELEGEELGDESGGECPEPEKRHRPNTPLSAEDKAQASRDRNREHARNTRLRKKQYLEHLHRQVEKLTSEKNRLEREQELATKKREEEVAARERVLLTMFYLRANGELSRRAWSYILDDSFVCTTPIAPYRSFLSTEMVSNKRVFHGVDGMIQDTASLAVFVESIGSRLSSAPGKKVTIQFYAPSEDILVVGDSLMCRWMMRTENAAQCGAPFEVYKYGMLKAKFSPQNRITSLEFVYDVMSFMQQLQRACGSGDFRVVPNTVENAHQPSDQMRVICLAEPPHCICHTSDRWSMLMGYTAEEARGCPLSLLKGGDLEVNALDTFLASSINAEPKRAGVADVTVTTKSLRPVLVNLKGYPLASFGTISYFLVVMEEVHPPGGNGLVTQPGMQMYNIV